MPSLGGPGTALTIINLSENFVLLDKEELALVKSKYTGQNQLLFAIMLKFFQAECCYPTQNDILPEILISSPADQLEITVAENYDFHCRR